MSRLLCAAAVAGLAMTTAVNAATTPVFTTQSGTITGITGLTVGGTVYDVAFLDGVGNSLFDNSSLAFSTPAETEAAATVLGDFLANAGLSDFSVLNGVVSTSTFYAWIPYLFSGSSFSGSIVNYSFSLASPRVQTDTWSLANYDTAANPVDFWASFSEASAAPVPLPATLPLILAALGGLGIARRRRSAS